MITARDIHIGDSFWMADKEYIIQIVEKTSRYVRYECQMNIDYSSSLYFMDVDYLIQSKIWIPLSKEDVEMRVKDLDLL